MAYFPNGCAGEVFDNQCGQCRYGEKCPIRFAQELHNYDAVNNETATSILNYLVKDDGICEMFKLDPVNFKERRVTPVMKYKE
ncbi:MAG TPA: hypothetical protein VJ044_06765 [Candidatus Hodarchaeales archaeon]|nr:hypothetical protein [Candidatus Hodarchaeales archaeon]